MSRKEKNLDVFQPDAIDEQILQLLTENAKFGNKEIANAIGLSISPTFERIKRLERHGIIKGYHAEINKKHLGIGLQAFCAVTLKGHNLEDITEFEHRIVHLEEVVQCYHLAGQFDYSLYIEVKDIDAYQHFLKMKLASIPNISNVHSSFILSAIKE